jgi:hypothetical protein
MKTDERKVHGNQEMDPIPMEAKVIASLSPFVEKNNFRGRKIQDDTGKPELVQYVTGMMPMVSGH